MTALELKKIFLVATARPDLAQQIEDVIRAHIENTSVFKAQDGLDAMFKCDNVPPHVVILDYGLTKVSALDLTEKLLDRKERTAVIILSPMPDQEHFIDQVVTGQVQFLSGRGSTELFVKCLTRALNWVSHQEQSTYNLRFLAPTELLLKEGEVGSCVYLVKSGKLKAYHTKNGDEIVLGYIESGEFVGEMAYINGEPRSADVISVTDCELIEINSHCLDAILFSKPAWSKALMKTLSRRLKISNDAKIRSNPQYGSSQD